MSPTDDIHAIQQLKARYFRMMDTKDWAGFGATFADDVVIDMTGEGGTITTGIGAFLTFLRPTLESVTTVHHGHMPEITLTSATTAEGVWAMEDELWWPDDSPLQHMHGYGHYHETYTKGADGWRIASLRLTRLRRDIEMRPNPALDPAPRTGPDAR